VIHTVAHRILRMTHAENRRSAVRKIRGVAYALTMLGWAISKERKPVAPPVNVAVVAPGAFANPTSTDLATIADPVFASYDNIATRAQLDSVPALAPEEFFDSLPDLSPAPAAMA